MRITFADESRFGRINRPRPCWAPIGIRPEVASQLIREYIYLYGAVSPKNRTCVYLIMPTSNTACFQAFLNVLARKFARQDILLVLDGAPNHRCGDLAVPRNIALLFLPPYSPELNPKENLWDEIREKIFKNYALKSIDAVRSKLKQAILYIERNRRTVQSITGLGGINDIAAWEPRTGRLGLWLGRGFALGETGIWAPQLDGELLPIWRSPWGWGGQRVIFFVILVWGLGVCNSW